MREKVFVDMDLTESCLDHGLQANGFLHEKIGTVHTFLLSQREAG